MHVPTRREQRGRRVQKVGEEYTVAQSVRCLVEKVRKPKVRMAEADGIKAAEHRGQLRRVNAVNHACAAGLQLRKDGKSACIGGADLLGTRQRGRGERDAVAEGTDECQRVRAVTIADGENAPPRASTHVCVCMRLVRPHGAQFGEPLVFGQERVGC